MTYGIFKQLLSLEMSADRRANPDLFITVLDTALRDVASSCIPQTLFSILPPLDIFRKVICDDENPTTDDVRYIRVPNLPTLDSDILDIDDLLCMAVLYGVCKILSQDRKDEFDVRMNKEICNYQWIKYEEVSNGICN